MKPDERKVRGIKTEVRELIEVKKLLYSYYKVSEWSKCRAIHWQIERSQQWEKEVK